MELSEALTGIVVTALASIAAAFLRVAWMRICAALEKWAASKDHALVIEWAKLAVEAAEQLHLDDTAREYVDDRLDYALSFVLDMARDAGVEVTEATARTLIEAFVHEVNVQMRATK